MEHQHTNNFKKMDYEKATKYEGGSFLSFLSAMIPSLLGSFGSVVGALNLNGANSGEFKSKDGSTYKWNKSEEHSNAIPVYYYF